MTLTTTMTMKQSLGEITHTDGPADTLDTSAQQVPVDRSLAEQDKVKLLAPRTAGL